MTTFTKLKLSGSTDGRGIKITPTTSAGTTVHTAVSGTSSYDEVWLWMQNNHTTTVDVTIEWGGTTNPDDRIIYTVQPKDGLKCMVPGLILQNGDDIKVFASVTNVISVHGFVNRIS